MRYTLRKETLDKVFNILSQLPYNQVASLINELRQDVKVKNCNCEDNNLVKKEEVN
jgi:hypothetical protein